jgi:hypothetical protein
LSPHSLPPKARLRELESLIAQRARDYGMTVARYRDTLNRKILLMTLEIAKQINRLEQCPTPCENQYRTFVLLDAGEDVRQIAIPIHHLKWVNGQIELPGVTKEALKKLPPFYYSH